MNRIEAGKAYYYLTLRLFRYPFHHFFHATHFPPPPNPFPTACMPFLTRVLILLLCFHPWYFYFPSFFFFFFIIFDLTIPPLSLVLYFSPFYHKSR